MSSHLQGTRDAKKPGNSQNIHMIVQNAQWIMGGVLISQCNGYFLPVGSMCVISCGRLTQYGMSLLIVLLNIDQ